MGGKMLDEATTVPAHRRLKEKFCQMFPHLGAKVVRWGKSGNDSVKLDLMDGRAIVFTYKNDSMWRLETIGYYISDGKKR